MNNITQLHQLSQVQHKEISPSSIGFLVSDTHPSIKRALQYLISRSNIYKSLYMRQDTIAQEIGSCTKTANRAVEWLHVFGFIFKHKRAGKKSCEYFVNGFFFTSPGRIILIIIFNISFLCVGSEPYVPQLTLTNISTTAGQSNMASATPSFSGGFYKKRSTISYTAPAIAPEYYHSSAWHEGMTTQGAPNQPLTDEQAEELFGSSLYKQGIKASADTISTHCKGVAVDDDSKSRNKKGNSMITFTEKQLEEIASHPQALYDDTLARYKRTIDSGTNISNHALYFMGIFASLVEKKQKTPKTGMTQAQALGQHAAKMQSQKEQEKYQRTHTNFVPGMPVVNHRNNRESVVTIVETESEWFMNVERTLHDRMLNDPTFNKNAAKYGNPLWDKVSQADRDMALKDIHQQCTCRTIVDRALAIVPTPVIVSQEPRDWNSTLPVSDNSGDIMSNEWLQPTFYEGSTEFEELLD